VAARFTPDGGLDQTLETGASFLASLYFDREQLILATAGESGAGGILRTKVDVLGLELTPARV
jgi:hypothetical protein